MCDLPAVEQTLADYGLHHLKIMLDAVERLEKMVAEYPEQSLARQSAEAMAQAMVQSLELGFKDDLAFMRVLNQKRWAAKLASSVETER